jgi:protein gp37
LTLGLARDLLTAVSDHSSIEWTDATWNPVRGCTKVSPGCKHCYAETFSERFRGVAGHPFEHGFDLRLIFAKLPEPLRWARARKIFVNSMSDLFHERVPDVYIEEVFRVMVEADWHVYQLLTKRADRLRRLTRRLSASAVEHDHIWLGVSVEDRQYGLPRIDELRRARAGKRFLSIEPLLEDLGEVDLRGIDWVIVGGESGPGARPMAEAWVSRLRDQCRAAKIPFFFKQWGGVQKKKNGRSLRGAHYDEFPLAEVGEVPPRPQRWARLHAAEARVEQLENLLGPAPLLEIRRSTDRARLHLATAAH